MHNIQEWNKGFKNIMSTQLMEIILWLNSLEREDMDRWEIEESQIEIGTIA